MHPNAVRVSAAAEDLGLQIEHRHFDDTTRTADDAARVVGVEVGQIVKSLVFDVVHDDGATETVIALVSGSNRCDPTSLAAVAGGAKTARVDAEVARAATGYPIGGIPPFGHASPLRVFADPDLLGYELVWAAAGTPYDNFAVDPTRLVEAIGATVADIGTT